MDTYYVVSIARVKPERGERDTVFSVHVTENGAAIVQNAIMASMLNPADMAQRAAS